MQNVSKISYASFRFQKSLLQPKTKQNVGMLSGVDDLFLNRQNLILVASECVIGSSFNKIR